MPKKPVDYYGDNPPDEGVDYNGPEIDYSNPMQKFDEKTLSEFHDAVGNVSSRASKGNKSRSQAADKLLNSDLEVR